MRGESPLRVVRLLDSEGVVQLYDASHHKCTHEDARCARFAVWSTLGGPMAPHPGAQSAPNGMSGQPHERRIDEIVAGGGAPGRINKERATCFPRGDRAVAPRVRTPANR